MRYGLLTFEEPVPDISRKILHVDMDAFYASVEARDNPQIANKPIVIAKHPKLTGGRGIVSTCNYIARQYGIHSAMSAAEAYKRCPHAVFIQGSWEYYASVSRQIREIFAQYTDLIEPLSLDEAYLDVTQNKIGSKSALYVAYKIQAHIKSELNLTCSIGVSYNKFIAKIASDYRKPSGITVVTPEQAQSFLHDLPIEKFYGVGRQSIKSFHDLGIRTGKELAQLELDELVGYFGKMGQSLYYKVRGVHNAPVMSHRERKSIGKETTFVQFLSTEESVLAAFQTLTKRVIKTLQAKDLYATIVTIKVRYANFETLTRQIQLNQAFQTYDIAYETVQTLWEAHGDLAHEVRLLGVTVSGLVDYRNQPQQLTLDRVS